ncbi:hypothetical protein GOP47_0009329 [Adiantum capillus-veneris]|uniref:Uncharacterized protein n=1 Tax=Adiantum capillus-veneris TaxID=13818 RepID=A0A9D4UWD3_ADICA|nr:hypothetical protein GOP47_0009329 [Adiantum capillus-veneris]
MKTKARAWHSAFLWLVVCCCSSVAALRSRFSSLGSDGQFKDDPFSDSLSKNFYGQLNDCSCPGHRGG